MPSSTIAVVLHLVVVTGVMDSTGMKDDSGNSALDILPGGVQYRLVKSDNGKLPTLSDKVLVN